VNNIKQPSNVLTEGAHRCESRSHCWGASWFLWRSHFQSKHLSNFDGQQQVFVNEFKGTLPKVIWCDSGRLNKVDKKTLQVYQTDLKLSLDFWSKLACSANVSRTFVPLSHRIVCHGVFFFFTDKAMVQSTLRRLVLHLLSTRWCSSQQDTSVFVSGYFCWQSMHRNAPALHFTCGEFLWSSWRLQFGLIVWRGLKRVWSPLLSRCSDIAHGSWTGTKSCLASEILSNNSSDSDSNLLSCHFCCSTLLKAGPSWNCDWILAGNDPEVSLQIT